MANIGYMQDQFESQKNMKAGSYTLLICGSLLVIFFVCPMVHATYSIACT